MKIAKTVFLIVFLVFAGCANEEIDHRLRAILGYADMGIVEFPIDERERPMIQVFMVSDPSKVPYYDVEENIYSEKTESISSSLL